MRYQEGQTRKSQVWPIACFTELDWTVETERTGFSKPKNHNSASDQRFQPKSFGNLLLMQSGQPLSLPASIPCGLPDWVPFALSGSRRRPLPSRHRGPHSRDETEAKRPQRREEAARKIGRSAGPCSSRMKRTAAPRPSPRTGSGGRPPHGEKEALAAISHHRSRTKLRRWCGAPGDVVRAPGTLPALGFAPPRGARPPAFGLSGRLFLLDRVHRAHPERLARGTARFALLPRSARTADGGQQRHDHGRHPLPDPEASVPQRVRFGSRHRYAPPTHPDHRTDRQPFDPDRAALRRRHLGLRPAVFAPGTEHDGGPRRPARTHRVGTHRLATPTTTASE